MIDPLWVEKLTFLTEREHQVREVLREKGILNDVYAPSLEKIHLENARKLSRMIEEMGFPVLSNAGEKGVHLSWFIIYQSIPWPDFMRDSLIQMRLAAAQDDYPLELLPYLDDRISYLEGRPQLYGTKIGHGIEDRKRMDLRRQALGLLPFSETILFPETSLPPKDPIKTQQDFENFLVRVGWRNS